MSILVYQLTEGTSNKYWAISNDPEAPGVFPVWYGRVGSKLRRSSKDSPNGSDAAITEKVRKGYVYKNNLTIDSDGQVAINTVGGSSMDDWVEVNNPLCFTWRIDMKGANTEDAVKVTLKMIEACKRYWSAMDTKAIVALGYSTKLYGDLCNGRFIGEVPYSEGIFSYLLLYALRRSMETLGVTVDVLDSNNQELSPRYNDDRELLAIVRQDWEMELCSNAKSEDEEAGIMGNVKLVFEYLNDLAIAVGAEAEPLNLKGISAGRSAYF